MKALEENDCTKCDLIRFSVDCILSLFRNKPGPDCPYRTVKSQAAKIIELEAQVAELVEALEDASNFVKPTNAQHPLDRKAKPKKKWEELLNKIEAKQEVEDE